MLCPEVWNFVPPSSLTSTKVCQSEEEILQTFTHQYFNHFVSIVIPDSNQIPKEVVDCCLDDSQYYRINKVAAVEFVKKNFVDCFLKKGSLTGFSISEFSEEDRIAVTPCGKLIFALTKNTYQTVGVECIYSKHSKTSLGKYFFVVDLLSNEGKKTCEILEKKLHNKTTQLCFDMVLAWEPNDQDVCPSSVAQYFHQKNYLVKTCDVVYNQKFRYNVSVPELSDDTELSEFVEWLGAFGLQCDMSSDDYISLMKHPEKKIDLGQVICMTFVGLITHKRLQRLISAVCKYAETKASLVWITMFIQSFQDSIISLKSQKMILSDGDQHKTIIFSNNQQPLVYSFRDKR